MKWDQPQATAVAGSPVPGAGLSASATRATHRLDAPATAGAVLLLPAPVFIGSSVLKYQMGIPFPYDALEPLIRWLDSPVILLGGLLGAAAVNAWAVTRIGVRRVADELVATVIIRTRRWNLLILVLSAMMLTALLTYVFLENFVPR